MRCFCLGAVWAIGANPDTVTLTHDAEYLANFPHKRRARRRYVRADTGERWIESLDDTDGIAAWSHGDFFPHIRAELVAAGHARVGTVGQCTAELLQRLRLWPSPCGGSRRICWALNEAIELLRSA